MKILRYLPIEIYALVLPSLLMLSGFLVWAANSTKQVNFLNFLKQLYQLVILGGHKLNLAFIALWLVFAIYLILNLRAPAIRTRMFSVAKSLVAINVFAGFTSLVLGLSTMYLTNLVSGGKVLQSTILIDKLEYAIFGNLPAVSLINSFSGSVFESIILYSYVYLFMIFSLSIIILAFSNKKIFRQTLVAFFLALLISIPFFTIIPATSPDGLYVANIFRTSNHNLQIKQSEVFSGFNNYFHQLWISENNNSYNVSSIPSLHVAWGLIAVLGIIMTRKKILSIIFTLWLIFNILGTFYSLQHYAVDVIAGVILGFVSFHLASLLIKFENKYYKGKDWYEIIDLSMEIKLKLNIIFSKIYRILIQKKVLIVWAIDWIKWMNG